MKGIDLNLEPTESSDDDQSDHRHETESRSSEKVLSKKRVRSSLDKEDSGTSQIRDHKESDEEKPLKYRLRSAKKQRRSYETDSRSSEKRVKKLKKRRVQFSLENEDSGTGQIRDHKDSDAAKPQQHRLVNNSRELFDERSESEYPEGSLEDKAPEVIDLAYLVSLPADVLEEFILTCPEARLATLPTPLLAQARMLRDDALRNDQVQEVLKQQRQKLKMETVLSSRERERFEEIRSQLSDEIVEGFKRARMEKAIPDSRGTSQIIDEMVGVFNRERTENSSIYTQENLVERREVRG